jgi:hypothetical protein
MEKHIFKTPQEPEQDSELCEICGNHWRNTDVHVSEPYSQSKEKDSLTKYLQDIKRASDYNTKLNENL